MTTRQRDWPRQWLMTDERLGERLWEAIENLPERSGVVFRHYATPNAERETLAQEVAALCRGRGLTLGVARDVELAVSLSADLVHNPLRIPETLPLSKAIHSIKEAQSARNAAAALVFVSPVFPTRSHLGQDPLGIELATGIAKATEVPAIALGGMDVQKFALLERDGFYGWAGIDAWLGDALRT